MLASLLLALAVTGADDLSVLPAHVEGIAPRQIAPVLLKREAQVALAARRAAYEKRTTVEQWQQYQQQMKTFFRAQLGGFPERTPLNARVVGKLQGDGFRVEKIIYSSRPRHRVTAALYLPDGDGPFPAVLIACGHTKTGKAAGYNQRMGILLAKNGVAAMCYDPIGQGERAQMLDDRGTARHSSSTREHFLVGVGSILVGVNTAQFRTYDGIRGIDYLASREDIDGKRIGCTGCSGGGTLTSYIMALDERVACAAPACYLTTFGHLIDSIGPQDAEQNIFGQLSGGLDHPDYVLMRAPRPTLICSTTADYFDIRGSWETFREAKRVYTRMGAAEKVDLIEVPGKHGIHPLARAAMVRWMRRWLLNEHGPVVETEFPIFTAEQLRCTPRGQVLLLDGEQSVFDLNMAHADQLKRQRVARPDEDDQLRDRIRVRAAVRPAAKLPKPRMKHLGRIRRDGYRIDKLTIHARPQSIMPVLKFVPAQANGNVVLYAHGDGKHTDAAVGGPIEKLVQKGNTVYAVDLTGSGELAAQPTDALLGDWKTYYLAYLLGRSLVGLRAEQVMVATAAITAAEPAAQVRLVGIGEAAIPALHAAALEPQWYSGLELRRCLPSWSYVLATDNPQRQLASTVHGALVDYDLPDLIRLAGRAQVDISEPVDGQGQPITAR